MRKLKKLIYFLLIICLSIVFFNWYYQTHNSLNPLLVDKPLPEGAKESEDQALALARLLIDQGRTQEALITIQRYDRFISETSPKGKEWIQLLIEASTKTQDSKELDILWTFFPEAFVNQEKAVLLVARHLLATGRTKNFEQLRKLWKGKETLVNDWFFLDADAISSDNDPQKTIDFLESRQLKGKEDALRLLKLAIEVSKSDPSKAWQILTKALEIDPKNSTILLYRANFLELIGKKEDAEAQYIAVLQTDPKNLSFSNQLADFFIRHGQYEEALTVLSTCLTSPTSDLIWLKTFFWNKVTIPISFDWKGALMPVGTSTSLLQYLIHLPENVYWDDHAFEDIADNKAFLRNIQPTLWLRVIQKLIDKEEKTAKEILLANPFSNYSLDPALEKALQQILSYRIDKTLVSTMPPITFPAVQNINGEKEDEERELFLSLDQASLNHSLLEKSLESLLNSEEAFAAAFLTAQWNRAAVALHRLDVYPDTFPLWMSIKMGQALYEVKGADPAMAFLDKQKPNDVLTLLKSQFLLADKQIDQGENLLLSIKAVQGETGKTAAWILAQLYLVQGKIDKAEDILNHRPDLSEEVKGKEISARIALGRKEIRKGEEIYKGIEDKSIEAQSYFAGKAFRENDLEKARDLTMKLLEKQPANIILRINLEQIDLKQKQMKGDNK